MNFAGVGKMGLKYLDMEKHLEYKINRTDRRWINYVFVKNMNPLVEKLGNHGDGTR